MTPAVIEACLRAARSFGARLIGLTSGAGSALVVTGAGTNATLISCAALGGVFGPTTLPAGYGISVSGNRVLLRKATGTVTRA